MRYNSPVRITSSAPTRIDLAGGTIDIWPLYLFHDGASTLNAAISLRAHVEIESRADGGVELRSIDTDRTVTRRAAGPSSTATAISPLLALLARHYRLENATLTTRGESPAGRRHRRLVGADHRRCAARSPAGPERRRIPSICCRSR